jgi:multidrug efflux pump
VLVILNRQPGANIIDVVDRIKAMIPSLQASIPNSITITPVNDRTTTIRASLRDVETTMGIAVLLVIAVVFVFLRNGRAALVPSVAVPISLLGTFGVMYLLGFSLDNLSLMALTVATGFVVDDAVVVLENISRHMEEGMPRMQAALLGAREVGFTVLSMTVSLIAVFLPILLMGGLIGRLFHEFAMTLSIAILISLVLSLTTTPMMCAYLGMGRAKREQGWLMRGSERVFVRVHRAYDRSLSWSLSNPGTIMVILALTIGLNVYLFTIIPKGFFPQQDTGSIGGGIRADQSISFQAMKGKFDQFVNAIHQDPAVQSVVGFSGRGGQTNTGNVFVNLKPLSERKETTDHVIARLRTRLGNVSGARLFLAPVQDLRVGGRQANAQYQYTIQSDTLAELETWVPRITEALQDVPELLDVNSDRQEAGLDVELHIDRSTAARLGVTATQIDNTLYDAFGQRQVSTIYKDLNQYHVVMEVAPAFWQNPETLRDVYVSTAGNITGTQASGGIVTTAAAPAESNTAGSVGAATSTTAAAAATDLSVADATAFQNQAQNQIANTARGGASAGASVSTRVERMVPLAAFSSYDAGTTPLSVNHQGPFVATTFSFNLPEGESLSDAVSAIQRTMATLHVPISVHGTFAGTARSFQQALAYEPLLILGALVTVYIVLGILYESLVHPITILSTLPSAGVGAVLALLIFGAEFSLIALIGVILLIGIVKKNAIMMIDFALVAQRTEGLDSREAIYRAALLRFRPIVMTTLAAIFGALPLALITGDGAELRQPLGISIVGGLLVSQLLTLYTTPVVYLYLDRFRLWSAGLWKRSYGGLFGRPREATP